MRGRGWETCGDVVRNVSTDGGGALEGRGVAAVTIRGIECVVIVGMAGRTRCCEVRAHQRKASNAVIERGRIPTCGGMTVCTIP